MLLGAATFTLCNCVSTVARICLLLRAQFYRYGLGTRSSPFSLGIQLVVGMRCLPTLWKSIQLQPFGMLMQMRTNWRQSGGGQREEWEKSDERQK